MKPKVANKIENADIPSELKRALCNVAQCIDVRCGQGEGSPEGFYLKQGFVPTGEIVHDEIVLRMVLTSEEKTQ